MSYGFLWIMKFKKWLPEFFAKYNVDNEVDWRVYYGQEIDGFSRECVERMMLDHLNEVPRTD